MSCLNFHSPLESDPSAGLLTGNALQRWKGICAYDGTDFLGWQSQLKGPTLQDCLEEQLAKILKQTVRVHGSGRTDAGVHAHGQVFHFDAVWAHAPEALFRALSGRLPSGFQLRSLTHVALNFHARFSAHSKRYRYVLYQGSPPPMHSRFCWAVPYPLDRKAMEAAAGHLLGRHNFRAFSAHRGEGNCLEDFVRTLMRLDLRRQSSRCLIWTVQADGFLYKMVRRLVGTLVEVGRGKLAPEAIPLLLAAQERAPGIITAPAQGLFLDKVFYDAPFMGSARGAPQEV